MPTIFEWKINSTDKTDGYEQILQSMREFVKNNPPSTDQNATISITAEELGYTGSISLLFTKENFEVTRINDHELLNYNYPSNLALFDTTTFPSGYPEHPHQVSPQQKAQLLFLFPEAARSKVIENAMKSALESYDDSVELKEYLPLVKNYKNVCQTEGVDITCAHPERPLKNDDYCKYAKTLNSGDSVRDAIFEICSCTP